MVRSGKPTRRQRELNGIIAFEAFQALYGISSTQAMDFAHNFNNAPEPYNLASRLHQALIPSKIPLVRKLDSLDNSVTNLAKLLDRVAQSKGCEGIFLFNYEGGKLKRLGTKKPEFEDYVSALEVAGAWEGKRPSDDEIRAMKSYGILTGMATYFPKEYETFIDTKGYKHIRDFSKVLRKLAEPTGKDNSQGNYFPAQRIGSDVLTLGIDNSQIRGTKARIDLEAEEVRIILRNPSELRRRLHGDESSEGILSSADCYRDLDHLLDLRILEEIPYSGITGPEHVRSIAPKLKILKGDRKGAKRAKPLKTFLELLSSTGSKQRLDLLDIIERSETEQGVDSLELYGRLRNTGLKPEDFVEFLRAGDQFDWRPEGSDFALSSLTRESYRYMDPVSAYLTSTLSNFNILDALDKITSQKRSVPAAKELMLNPSLLFLDNNAVELMTLARDYNQGRLIIERYATVMAEGLHKRAEAILHVGQLRPSRLDLKFIRERMRSLDESEMSSVIGCNSTEELKDLLKSKEKNTSQKLSHTEGISWFNLMKKRMGKRGSTEENIHSVEEAHELLSNHGGNPRLLRNMFRTQPRNLGDLCSHVKTHAEDETFGVMMQRDALFQRYKLGLATVEGFSESFSKFVSEEHQNPFQALQSYLPHFSKTEEVAPAKTKSPSLSLENPEMSEFKGRIFVCGGIFREQAQKKLQEMFPSLTIYSGSKDNKRNHKDGIREQLNSEDAVFIIKSHFSHTESQRITQQCKDAGINMTECPTQGLSSVMRFVESEIGSRMAKCTQENS